MALTDRPITIVTSMVPTMILVLGVADATHLLRAFLDRRAAGIERFVAAREAAGELALPNLMTTATSAAGFLWPWQCATCGCSW
jgi:predicted RND superfamily exporter protein